MREESWWIQIEKNMLESSLRIKSVLDEVSALLKPLSGSDNSPGGGATVEEIVVGADSVSLVTRLTALESTTVKLVVTTDDFRDAAFSLLREGSYELTLSEILFRIVNHSDCFWDIGSNIGFYSLGALLVNPDIQAHSFEPNPNLWPRFAENSKINALSDAVHLHGFGLGDEDAKVKFFVPPVTGSGGGSLRDLHPEEGSASIFEIELRRPSTEVAEAPDLCKIDVEGAELSVIIGNDSWILHNKPTIFVELLRKWMAPFGTHPQQVLDEVFSLGYVAYEVLEADLQSISVIDDTTVGTNFILIHPTRESHLQVVESYLKPR